MTSLTRFKKKLRGEIPEKTYPKMDEWLKLVTEIEMRTDESVQEIDMVVNEEENAPIEIDLESMTKVELEDYAQEHDIELDRRKTKLNMITEFIQKLKEKN